MDLSQLPPETLAALMPLIMKMQKVRTAHGIITSLAVLIWFPLGMVLLRMLKVKNTVWWHAIWQGIGLGLMTAGFGMGRWLSGKAKHNNEPHIILGTIIFILFLLMPIAGFLHHKHFAAKGARDYKRHIHVWGGRVLLILGLVNGFTGLKLAKAKGGLYAAYGVVAGVFVAAYIGIWYFVRRRKNAVCGDGEVELRERAQGK
ncbi:integral membrane protein [Paraphoma chrysanthemicola]|nr:integral membrane protein [Paraphoma chrysanthemicola]